MDAKPDPAREARLLLRAARVATLATSMDGQPFASLVTPAAAGDGSVLLLLSDLSEHTRHLRKDARCSVMMVGPATSRNPQTAPRLTLTGLAEPETAAELKARWVALHPYAAFYAGFGDFHLWRVRPVAGWYIGGFASAHRLHGAVLAPDPETVAALADAEAGIVAHCNADHTSAMDIIAQAHGGAGQGWRIVACDADGCDLALDEAVIRVPWSAPVSGAGGVRSELVRLAHAARNPLEPPPGPAV